MDEIDRALLQILQKDTTLSTAEMAAQVGLTPTPCWKRIQKLEASGVITGRVAIIDPVRVGVGLSVFVAIEAGEHTPDWLKRFSADMAEHDAFYKRLIAIAPMKNVTSRFAMERMKHTTAYPLHPRAFRDRHCPKDGQG